MSVHAGPADWWTDETDIGRTHIATKGIVQSGLVFNLDAGVTTSYPGTEATFADLEANHNLTLYNSPTFSSTNGGSIVFNGTSHYAAVANIPISSPISLTTNFTIEQVFKPTAYQVSNYYGLTNMLLHKGSASTYNYATQLGNDTTFDFIKRTAPEGLQYHRFTVPSMLNKINIVTLVIENGDNTSIDTVSCYFNGNFISSQSIAGAVITAVNNDPFYLGSLGPVQYTHFTGNYYAGRIYNRALSASEVQQNFNATRSRYGI